MVRGLFIGVLVGLLIGWGGAWATRETDDPLRLEAAPHVPPEALRELAIQVRWMRHRLMELERDCAP